MFGFMSNSAHGYRKLRNCCFFVFVWAYGAGRRFGLYLRASELRFGFYEPGFETPPYLSRGNKFHTLCFDALALLVGGLLGTGIVLLKRVNNTKYLRNSWY
jgi:hypothetical protein